MHISYAIIKFARRRDYNSQSALTSQSTITESPRNKDRNRKVAARHLQQKKESNNDSKLLAALTARPVFPPH